ncbi:MAG: glycosyltransferase family 4 protein [Candidatus Micrarchaeia archaeon]|jgi:glycosyltransferase involved in cell wall biosynthesis
MDFINFFHSLNKEFSFLLNSLSERKLKIAIISYYFEPPIISGVGVHSQFLAEFLVKNNCEVHVFCSNADYETYKTKGVIVHNIGRVIANANGSSSKIRLEYFLFESEVVKAVVRENTKREFDIIHTHGSLTKASFILKEICGLKWVHTFHAIEKDRIKKLSNEEKQFENLISWIESNVNYCNGAIYVSSPIYAQGKKLYKIKKSIVIPNGVDTRLFKPSPIRKKNVLFIGRFSKEKGIELFPEIIEKVMSVEGATITILTPYEGLSVDMEKIRDKMRIYERKYENRIRIITDPIGQDYIAELYSDCQLYIQPSTYESFGLCIVEAMASGRPVVAFKVGGIPELVGDCGFVVKDKESLLSKIEELLNDVDLCQKTGEKARARAESYNWNIIAKKTIDFYKVILNE